MSAIEVIEQIKSLPQEEREKVAAFVRKSETSEAASASTHPVSESFKRVADEVFTTNAELFRKLAQ